MLVFFYTDPEFAEDSRMVNVDLITLSYTFFEAKEGHTLPVPGYNSNQQLSPASNLWFLKNHVPCLLRELFTIMWSLCFKCLCTDGSYLRNSFILLRMYDWSKPCMLAETWWFSSPFRLSALHTCSNEILLLFLK